MTSDVDPVRKKSSVDPVTGATEKAKVEGQEQDTRTQSTISKSKKKVDSKDIVDAAIPLLPLWISFNQIDNSFNVNSEGVVSAVTGINPLELTKLYNDATTKIKSDLMSNWLNDIIRLKELAAKHYAEHQAPQAEYYRKQQDELLAGMQSVLQDQRRSMQHKDLVLFDSLPPLTTSFFIGLSFVGGTMVAEVAHGVVRAAEEAAKGFSQIVGMVAAAVSVDDFRAELGLIGGLMAMMNQITTEGVAAAGTVRAKPIDLDYARNYAKNVIQVVNSNEIDAFLRGTLIARIEKTGPVDEERQEQLIKIVKIVLLAMALGMLYRVQTGWITGREFSDMISGQMQFADNEIGRLEKQLATLINLYSQSLSSTERANLLRALTSYFATKPSLENLRDPERVFGGLLGFLKPNGHQGPV